jgi:predicted methyltransferase
MRRTITLALLCVAGAAPWAWAQTVIPPAIAAAVANPARPEEDRAADAARKPAETLTFAGVAPGQVVVDMLPGHGYFTRLFCTAVGPTGRVYQLALTALPAAGSMMMMAGGAMHGPTPPAAPFCANVTKLSEAVTAISLPVPADLIFTSRNYHDLHDTVFGKPDMLVVDRAIYAALKPGGVFVVLDHADTPGTGTRDTQTLHRIDPAAVKQEVTAAGFVYVGSSDVLRNPHDDHSKPIFDPTIRGHTDQFILKFRKPG